MKNAVYAQILSVTFIFLSRFLFTIFPNIIRGNISYVITSSLLYLAANAVPIWFFLELRQEVNRVFNIQRVFDLLITCLVLNLVHRFLIVLLTLELSTVFIQRFLFVISPIIPVVLYGCMVFFFMNLSKKSENSKFSGLKNIYQMNEIGFGLLALITAAGLIDHLTGGNLYRTISSGSSPVKMISFLIIIYVYYASLRFYLGILKISEGAE